MAERNQIKLRECKHPGCGWKAHAKAHELKEHEKWHRRMDQLRAQGITPPIVEDVKDE